MLTFVTHSVCACRATPSWTAPELYIQNHPANNQSKRMVTAKADIYSAGWVFFEVLCGLSPQLFREAISDDQFAAGP